MDLKDKIEKLIKPRCCECGDTIEEAPASKNPSFSLCCNFCKPVSRVKEKWTPLLHSQVSRIFVLK